MTDLNALAQKANAARKLAEKLELEAQSAHGERWNELRGDLKGPGLIWEAEMEYKTTARTFREELERTAGLTQSELLLLVRA